MAITLAKTGRSMKNRESMVDLPPSIVGFRRTGDVSRRVGQRPPGEDGPGDVSRRVAGAGLLGDYFRATGPGGGGASTAHSSGLTGAPGRALVRPFTTTRSSGRRPFSMATT